MPLHVRQLPANISQIISDEGVPKEQSLFNPSIAGNFLYVRLNIHAPTSEQNHILIIDIAKGSQHVIPSPDKLLAKTCNLYQGLEDLRICLYKNRLWFTATSTHSTNHMKSEMVLGYFDTKLTCVEHLAFIDVGTRPSKNVCPFVVKDKLMLVDFYTSSVFELCENPESDGKKEDIRIRKVLSLKFGAGIPQNTYRGSTSPVHLRGNTWGCVVHDIIFCDKQVLVTQLSYLNHWVEFDISTGVISFVSTPFFIAHWGVEFISGISYSEDKRSVDLYFSIQDNKALVAKTNIDLLRVGK